MRWIVLSLAYNGWLALCLTTQKHFRQVGQREPSIAHTLLRSGGWLAVALSLGASVAASGWSFGKIELVSMLAVTGLTLIFLLPHAPCVATMFAIVAFV